MKINIVGGGPAGLYFAILMKAADSSHQITLYERNLADITWGWGVVFSDKTLGYLEKSDKVFHDRLAAKLVNWTDVVMLYQGQEVRIHGNPFSSISRLEILNTLQHRCEELSVVMHFDTAVEDLEPLLSADLVIGADGIHSMVREHFSSHFEPEHQVGKNKFIWLGTKHLFNGLTLGFVQPDAGTFACHAYRFCDDTSTFIAECTEKTWKRAGLDTASEAETLDYLATIFSKELGGQPLMSNNSSWINFKRFKNTHWHHDNVVLLGDALHTAHFSIGSGTKLALEDAIVLKECLDETADISKALANYENTRRPAVEKIQAAAETSRIWFEEMDSKMGPAPHLFAYDCMIRSGRVDLEKLRVQDEAFVVAYEKAKSTSS